MLKLHNAKAHKIAFLGFAPTASTKLILRLHCHRSRDSAELEPCLARLWLRLHCTPFLPSQSQSRRRKLPVYTHVPLIKFKHGDCS